MCRETCIIQIPLGQMPKAFTLATRYSHFNFLVTGNLRLHWWCCTCHWILGLNIPLPTICSKTYILILIYPSNIMPPNGVRGRYREAIRPFIRLLGTLKSALTLPRVTSLGRRKSAPLVLLYLSFFTWLVVHVYKKCCQ